jgi:hypothetical protein
MDLRISRYKRAIILITILLVVAFAWWLKNKYPYEPEARPAGIYGTYSTNFPDTENPISEGGKWINGKESGLDWSDVRTIPGFAFGTQSGSNGYDDSTSVLAGVWGPTQTVSATIRLKNPPSAGKTNAEVELRLRTKISPHKHTGYEVNFSCSANPANFYAEIVRWNATRDSFTYLNRNTNYHCADGDIVKATISGRKIEVFVNNALIMQASDWAYATGNPGIGFFIQRTGADTNSDFGFSSFTASDSLTEAKQTD